VPLPDFVVIGAQKAGTTSLYRMLRKHPQVHMPKTKELHYFDFHYDQGPQWYAAQFRPGRWERRRGEATPNYMWGPLARQRLIADLPDARIVAILRNPVDRAYSHYWHDRRRREMDRHDRTVQPTFEQALAQERPATFGHLVEAVGGEAPDPDRPTRGNFVLRGEYADQLEPYLAAYDRNRVHLMLLDDLVADREGTLRDLFGFLRVLKRPARTIEDAHANRFRRQDESGRVETSAYQPIDPATRELLAEHYRSHNERLGRILGRDLAHWR
jgi:hypothetical protein